MPDGRAGLIAPGTLLLAAALSGTPGASMGVLSLMAAGGVLIVVLRPHRELDASMTVQSPLVLAVATITGVTTMQQLAASGKTSVGGVWLAAGLASLVAGHLAATQRSTIRWTLLVGGTLCVGLAGLAAAQSIDVVAAHEAAADRLLAGQSPFRDLGVLETDPIVDGSVIDGYPYPPVNLLVFGLLGRALGSPRLVSLLLWIGAVVLMARRNGVHSPAPTLLAVLPGYPLTVLAGWTEPLMVLLLVGTVAGPSEVRRAGSAGAFLASKQYVIVATLAALGRWRRDRRAVLVILLTAMVLTVPVVLDLRGALDSLVAFHTDHVLRPDSSNLAGILAQRRGWTTWPVPTVFIVALAVLVGATVALRRPVDDGWLGGLLSSLVVLLVLGPVSLPNYWLLVAAGLVCWLSELTSSWSPEESEAKGTEAASRMR